MHMKYLQYLEISRDVKKKNFSHNIQFEKFFK